jgi:hypothetical protein
VLGRCSLPIAFSEETETVFIGAIDSEKPEDPAGIYGSADWRLIYPVVPDTPPADDGSGGGTADGGDRQA